MFTLIRGVIIVGLIFYFSPVRDRGEPGQQTGRGEREPASAAAAPATQAGLAQQGLWGWIPGSLAEDVVRTAVTDKAQEAGLRLKDQVARSLPERSPKAVSVATLPPERDLALRGSPSASVRCIYRCDGAE